MYGAVQRRRTQNCSNASTDRGDVFVDDEELSGAWADVRSFLDNPDGRVTFQIRANLHLLHEALERLGRGLARRSLAGRAGNLDRSPPHSRLPRCGARGPTSVRTAGPRTGSCHFSELGEALWGTCHSRADPRWTPGPPPLPLPCIACVTPIGRLRESSSRLASCHQLRTELPQIRIHLSHVGDVEIGTGPGSHRPDVKHARRADRGLLRSARQRRTGHAPRHLPATATVRGP